MAIRLVSAAIGIPILVTSIWIGFPLFLILITMVSLLALLEIYQMAEKIGARPYYYYGFSWTLILLLGVKLGNGDFLVHMTIIGFIVSLFWLIYHRNSNGKLRDWIYSVMGPLYAGWIMSHAIMLRNSEHGREWILFVIITTFATDTFALVVGKLFGRHQMAPSISPGKTWEGAGGGLLAAIIASFGAYSMFSLEYFNRPPIGLEVALLLGAIIGIVSQIGDLAESKMKRMAGVKDAGTGIPGHGGVLDRLDSIVIPLLFIYYFRYV